jgi:molybdopterin molybdotransferase
VTNRPAADSGGWREAGVSDRSEGATRRDLDTAEHGVLFQAGREGQQGQQGQHGHDHGHGDEPMRSVEEVRGSILAEVAPLEPFELPLAEAYGCVLAGDVTSPLDLPPFDSSAMDGFAVRARDIEDASVDEPASLRIVGRVLMGREPDVAVGHGEAVRIATGAPVPRGADAIVPIEHALVQGESALVMRTFAEGASVRRAGQDAARGDVLVPAGRRLSGAELGMLASAGFAVAKVYPRPRVAILSTGDELVEPGRPITYGQIRDSNSYTLFGAIREAGASPLLGGIVGDDVDQLRDVMLGLVSRADVFVSSGGVSVGERDVVKRAFFRRGDISFYRVAMQPGMPQGFGQVEGRPYFGLPGNPVSVFVSFEMFIRPALLRMMGRRDLYRPEVDAELVDEIRGPSNRTVFARVRVRRAEGRWVAESTGGGQSNLLSTVTRANGLAVLPVGQDMARPGERVRVILFRSLGG